MTQGTLAGSLEGTAWESTASCAGEPEAAGEASKPEAARKFGREASEARRTKCDSVRA